MAEVSNVISMIGFLALLGRFYTVLKHNISIIIPVVEINVLGAIY